METEREKTLRQMLERERNYSESLKDDLRKCTDPQECLDIQVKIHNVEKIIMSLTEKLRGISGIVPGQVRPELRGIDFHIVFVLTISLCRSRLCPGETRSRRRFPCETSR
jgi:hypothetical protein